MRTEVTDATANASTIKVWGWGLFRALQDRKGPVVLIIAVCSCFITYCRLALHMNIVCTHFVYIPVVLTGMWWGRKSIWVGVLFGTLVFCLRPFASTAEPLAADVGRTFFFVLVAFCVGTVSEMADAALRAEEKSRKELEAAQRQLVVSERLASMGQLSAAVAHEVNNPLGTVLLYSHMLLKEMKDEDPGREDLQLIVNEATRCKDIVRGLLDFARQSRVSKAPTQLSDIVEEVVSIMAPKGKAAGVCLASDVADGLPTMMIDRTQIKQMLVNLVQNGIDAIPGSGEVGIAARMANESDAVEITVSDNGCGIPQESIPKLFTPFFTTKELGQGTGLGLAIAYGVVKMHYGDISVVSEEGKGTTFSICIPVGREEQDEREIDLGHVESVA